MLASGASRRAGEGRPARHEECLAEPYQQKESTMGQTIDETKAELKEDLKRGLAHIQTLRDEVKVRLHLASLDVKEEWNKLEPHLLDVEKAAREATEASRRAVGDAVEKLKKIRKEL
jgi:hypothetical protein